MRRLILWALLVLSVILVVVGCGLKPGKSIVGEAIKGPPSSNDYSRQDKIQDKVINLEEDCLDEWYFVNKQGQVIGGLHKGCEDVDKNGQPWCATRGVYVTGEKYGTDWLPCGDDIDKLIAYFQAKCVTLPTGFSSEIEYLKWYSGLSIDEKEKIITDLPSWCPTKTKSSYTSDTSGKWEYCSGLTEVEKKAAGCLDDTTQKTDPYASNSGWGKILPCQKTWGYVSDLTKNAKWYKGCATIAGEKWCATKIAYVEGGKFGTKRKNCTPNK